MTTVDYQNKVRIDEDKLVVEDFQTKDIDIVSYFANLSESENLSEKFVSALKVGVVAAKTISTAGNVNYVERAFASLDTNFKQRIEQVFGENGQFSNLLNGQFGQDGKIIKELFDPHREGSPLFALKRELEQSLLDIKEKIGINAAVKEVEQKSTQKGFVFEDYCEQKLSWISKIHSDQLERTGNTVGKTPPSKNGDFVLTLDNIGKKIVFEMKDIGSISLKDIHKELDEAMQNRESDYGVFVAKNKDSLPESVGWFNEYPGNHLVCALENNGDSMIDGEVLHIAYKWARARLRIENSKETKLDPSFIVKKLADVQNSIGDLRKVKTQCTNIDNATEKIREISTAAQSKIKADLEEILQSLNTQSQTSPTKD